MFPGSALSWHCTWAGNTAASRSSERIRCSGAGTFLPPECRSRARKREAFQRQRVPYRGAWNTAWVSTSSTVLGDR